MKLKRIVKHIFIVLLFFIILNCNNVYSTDIKKSEYSKKYQEWLQLSDEVKNNTIPPFPVNIRQRKRNSSYIEKIKSALKTTSIPGSYDLRDYIDIEVKDQKNTGECWAFTANTSLETYLSLHNETYNFSERHIDYDTSTSFIDDQWSYSLNREVGSGGYSTTAFAYYSRGSGPVLEEDMPFEDNEAPIALYELPKNISVKKIDNMLYFPNIYKKYDENNNIVYTDADEVEYSKDEIIEIRKQVKEHIMNNGGISVSIDAPYNGCYYNESTHGAFLNNPDTIANHAVTIIGWDDHYSKNNFYYQPKEDGAYIILNSWGSEWGDNGVYYVSYEDFLIESQMRGIVGISNINYDNLYQYDISEMQNTLEYKYGANVFTSKNDENLTEILVGSLSDQECNIYVNTQNDNLNIQNLTRIASNVKLKPGYNTIQLNNPEHIEEGNKFAIVVEIISKDDIGIGIEDNNDVYFGNARSNEGESFVSENGIDWQDIYDENNMMNLSIKAYTKTDNKNFNVSNIDGNGYANIGGSFSFSIKTSYVYSQNKVEINIFNDLGENVTEKFEIKGDEVRGNGAFIRIECPNDIECGQYEAVITKPNSYETISRVFQIDANTGEYITAKFEDKAFWRYVKGEITNAVSNSDDLTISAKKTDFDKVKEISETYGKGITDITGIEYLTNLESINLNNNNITDFTPLSNLQNLNSLYIELNDCVDFSSLSNLSNLKELHLGGNNMNNGLGFLQNLSNLERLRLAACEVPDEIDISYIFNLSKLQYLDLTLWIWITEDHLQELSNLSNLKDLELSSCNIGNIDFIEGLQLESLYIGNDTFIEGYNHISDLSVIRNMNSLTSLDISKLPEIKTLDDLENLSNLVCLWCQDCSLCDATVLDGDSFKDKIFWDNLSLKNNIINDEIIRTGETTIIEVPKIIQQACNENSLLYSSNGVSLYNCEWEEYGKSVRINSYADYIVININSGYAQGTWYNGNIVEQEIWLDYIEITNKPNKTSYIEGQEFDKTGMIVTATYNDGSTKEITNYIIIDGKNLQEGKTTVIISYTEDGIKRTTTQAITVNKELVINIKEFEQEVEEGTTYLTGINPNTTIGEFKENIITNGSIIIIQDEDRIIEVEETKIATKMKMDITRGEKTKEYIIIVTGDCTGDGEANIKDMVRINNYRLYGTITNFGTEYQKAADVNKDGIINIKDMVKINNYRLYGTNL